MEPYIKCDDRIKCISTEKLCDMRSDCYDESDENPEMCRGMLTKHVKVNLKRRNKMKKQPLAHSGPSMHHHRPRTKQCTGAYTYTTTNMNKHVNGEYSKHLLYWYFQQNRCLDIKSMMYTTYLDYHEAPVHVVLPGNYTTCPCVKTTLTEQFQNIIVKS